MTSILEQLHESIDDFDLEKMECTLTYIRKHDTHSYFHHNMDFADAFESFLLSIPKEISKRMEQEHILRLFLGIIDPSLVFPSMRPIHSFNSNHDVDLTMVHNLCMEGRHETLRMLLSQIHPQIACHEARRRAWLSIEYSDNFENIHAIENYFTPMHIAWNGALFDRNIEEDLAKIYSPSDLDKDLANIWKTSVYLLLAHEGQPLNLTLADSADWNILHAIIRYGHGAHNTLTKFGLKIHPNLAREFDRDGNLALHLAAKQQIYFSIEKNCHTSERRNPLDTYKDSAYLPILPTRSFSSIPMDVDMDTETHSCGSCCAPTKKTPETESTISMVAMSYPFAASVFDKAGRLPLHLFLIHHEENLAIQDKIDEKFMDEVHGCHMDTLNDIMALVDANPRALDCVEPTSGLPPFMLAASCNGMPLDVVFALLSQNPMVLETFVVNR